MSLHKKYVITMDIGGTHIRTALLCDTDHLQHKTSTHTPHITSGASLTNVLAQEITHIITKHPTKNIVGIGISVAGPLDVDGHSFYFTAYKKHINLLAALRTCTSLPIFLLNDTKAAIYAVHKKEFPTEKNLAYVTISTGIGVGAIADNHLISGNAGNAGELGHATVVSPYTEGTHSWEHYASGKRDNNKGIIRFYQKWAVAHNIDINHRYTEPKHLFTAHTQKAPDIRGFMSALGKINAQGVANVIFAYNPKIIVFGGSIAYHNYDVLIAGIRKHIRRDLISPLPRFTRTQLADNASLYGSGYWTFEQLQ